MFTFGQAEGGQPTMAGADHTRDTMRGGAAQDDRNSRAHASRDPADIEREIDAIRGRMEETLRALEGRLSPDRLVESATSAFRNAGQVGPILDDLADAVRRNPLPLLLIGAGVAWIAYDLLRRDGSRPAAMPRAPLPEEHAAAALVADLVGVARQATRALRRAGMHLPEGPTRLLLREAAEERGLTAALLQSELHRLVGWTVHGDAPGGVQLAGWRRVEALLADGTGADLPDAVAAAEAETEECFRAALAHDLPGELHLIVAARLMEVRRTRERLAQCLARGATGSEDGAAERAA